MQEARSRGGGKSGVPLLRGSRILPLSHRMPKRRIFLSELLYFSRVDKSAQSCQLRLSLKCLTTIWCREVGIHSNAGEATLFLHARSIISISLYIQFEQVISLLYIIRPT